MLQLNTATRVGLNILIVFGVIVPVLGAIERPVGRYVAEKVSVPPVSSLAVDDRLIWAPS